MDPLADFSDPLVVSKTVGKNGNEHLRKDYIPNDWKLLFDLLRHSIICVHKIVHSVPL